MKLKRLFVLLIAIAVVASSAVLLTACNNDDGDTTSALSVAMITDYGDITDQSFNQTTYEACKAWSEANNASFKYYKPSGDSTEARVASVNQAIQAGYEVIVMPGYAFAETAVEVAERNPNVKFVALDVAQYDLDTANGGAYTIPANLFCAVYKEEISGYFAGYAAVKEGYKELGFLGGMAVPAVIRFGYGFVQGANAAAVEMGIADQVSIEYVYGGQFYGDADITAVMDTWYGTKGVEVVFACGGGIYTSACEAATKTGVNGKVIGVDVDQSYIISGSYGDGVCVTSATKGLAATVNASLSSVLDNTWAEKFGAKLSSLGLVSGTDMSVNYVELPTETWSMTNYTIAEYKALVKKVFDGDITVSDDITAMPATTITVVDNGSIKSN